MLNKEQKQAIEILDGPVRIIAGAGTGKTFTLIARIVELVRSRKVSPVKILCLTFTNKAAGELKERLIAKDVRGVNVMTFHSLAARMLRQFCLDEFRILDAREREEILKEVVGYKKGMKMTKAIEAVYKAMLAEMEALDFDGLIEKFIELLKDEDSLKDCQELFEYILVDEYQDVNEEQIYVLKKLSAEHKNICVVGDGDQTIYSWRGADANNMKRFSELFQDVKTVVLKKNYRNPSAILEGASTLIQYNSDRIEKEYEAMSENDGEISLWELKNYYQEMETLAFLLERYLGSTSGMHDADNIDVHSEGRNLGDIAILYRTQQQGRQLAKELTKLGYPFQISSGEGYWEQNEIKKIVQELELIKEYNPNKIFSEWLNELVNNFIESGQFGYVQIARLKHLLLYGQSFNKLDVFLDEIKVWQEADNLVFADRINLLTLHSAKGLEFPVVMIFGLEEGLLPSKKSLNNDYYLEEERRLLFVGMTRALEDLHLFTKKERSRFLGEIGLRNMVLESLPEDRLSRMRKKEFKKAQMKMF